MEQARTTRLVATARQTIAAAVVSTMAFMFGTSIGWPSPVQHFLQSEESPFGKLSDPQISWLASLTFAGGMTGPFFWSRITDRFGRKVGSYLVSGSFLLGWGLTAFSHNLHCLLTARFINGFGGAGAMILAPTYVSETAQDRIRGVLGSLVMLSLNAGLVFSYILGAELSYRSLNLACLVVPVLFYILFVWMPESPQYLWNKGKIKEAQNAMLWLRGGNFKCVEQETCSFSKDKQEIVGFSALMKTRGRRMAMLIGLGLFTWQQLSGIVPILSYASFIFLKSASSVAPERATIIVGVIQLFASVISLCVIDRYGRKLLLYISQLSMGLALTTLAIYFRLDNAGVDVSTVSWIPVVSLSVHVLTYALGAGPVPYIVMSEILPIDIKGLAVSLIIEWGTLLAFINAKVFTVFIETIGLSGCLSVYALFTFMGFFFTLSCVPETKGKALQDILLRLNGYAQVEVNDMTS